MKIKKNWIWSFFSLLISFILVSCYSTYYNPINYTTNEGQLLKSKTEAITMDYQINSTEGFYASIDFDLIDGKVEWEITNPKGETVYSGYAVNENGKTYREMTYPQIPNYALNKKEEIKEGPDFGYLQFEVGSIAGLYTLKLMPSNAEGNYTVQWSDKLPRK